MEITGKTALVTGANRGLGRQRAAQLRDRGAPAAALGLVGDRWALLRSLDGWRP